MSELHTESDLQFSSPEHSTAQVTTAPQCHFNAFSTMQSLAITVVIAVFVITFITQAFQIPSESMEQTLLIGDYLLVDKAHYAEGRAWRWLMPYRPVERQDIIVFRYPLDPKQHFVKRVVAVPGDHVKLVDKHVYVNGVRQQDGYASFQKQRDHFRDNFPDRNFFREDSTDNRFHGDTPTARWFLEVRKLLDNGELIVPEDCYFVLGDNRDDSYDSRYWGFVPKENVVGRPLVIYWSIDRADPSMEANTERGQPSDKLASLALTLTRWFTGLRWHRMLHTVQ